MDGKTGWLGQVSGGALHQSDVWEELQSRVPDQERSTFVREAVRDALMRRAAERLRGYYTNDAEAVEWAEFIGDDGGE